MSSPSLPPSDEGAPKRLSLLPASLSPGSPPTPPPELAPEAPPVPSRSPKETPPLMFERRTVPAAP
ncbi:hypothetical protein TALK_21505 [Thalassospira alkalitolerans]|uniref:Uncharacterized protein n=1 Tax=Thalassospira alkalitolerans TaxID=1293890 RepID=A0A1Y2L5J0_9PROT|nr:hypothetical protein TALK_21505 [Thalassospira alkalitolerans]